MKIVMLGKYIDQPGENSATTKLVQIFTKNTCDFFENWNVSHENIRKHIKQEVLGKWNPTML